MEERTTASETVTVQSAWRLPLLDKKLTVVEPAALAVTRPVSLTVATVVLLLPHIPVWSVVLLGVKVTLSCFVPLTIKEALETDIVTAVASTLLTLTLQVSWKPPSAVVTVIVALPALTPVTTPPLTEATLESEEDQVTALLVASLGETVAVRLVVAPTLMLAVEDDRLTPVTATLAAETKLKVIEEQVKVVEPFMILKKSAPEPSVYV